MHKTYLERERERVPPSNAQMDAWKGTKNEERKGGIAVNISGKL